MQAYSRAEREHDATALPDLEIFEMTAAEVAASPQYEDERWEYSHKHNYRLANMNRQVREAMIDAMVAELGIKGGWFYWYCFPGCMPDSEATGPFNTSDEALADAREQSNSGD